VAKRALDPGATKLSLAGERAAERYGDAALACGAARARSSETFY